MSLHRCLIYATVAFAVAGAASVPAAADTITYQYVGNIFDTFSGTPPADIGDHLTINIQLDGTVADGTVYSTDWLSWSMSAGTLSASSAAGDTIESTGAFWGGAVTPASVSLTGGSVTSWDIFGIDIDSGLPVYYLASVNTNTGSAQDLVQPFTWGGTVDWYATVLTPGTWSTLEDGGGEAATPEPATLGLLACGALLLFVRRQNRAA